MATTLRPWLRLGPASEAAREHAARNYLINVLEWVPTTPYDEWIPVLRHASDDEVEADVNALNRVVEAVRVAREARRVVYLHCGQGMERSPLTAAWVMWKLGEASTFDDAYAEVTRLHPITQNREAWVPWGARYPSHRPA